MPAYNEAVVIGAMVRAVLASAGAKVQLIVVDDGSTDETAQIVSRVARLDSRVHLVRQPINLGKAAALNAGLAASASEYVVVIDADTQPEPDFIDRMIRPLVRGQADAVAGNVKVGNQRGLLGQSQTIEYAAFHGTRLRQGAVGSITTIAGAAGAMRRSALEAIGGYSSATKAEDADLTLRLRQHGFRVTYAPGAVVRTEVPSSWRALVHQRVRWFYGNLQCIVLQCRRRGTRAGIRLPGLPTFVYENVVSPILAFGRAIVPLVALLGWHSYALWYAYLGVFAVFWAASALTLAREGEPLPRPLAIAFQYAAWPVLVMVPYAMAVWMLLSRHPIRWCKAERSGIAGAACGTACAANHARSGRDSQALPKCATGASSPRAAEHAS